jgi:transcriptional antiterminator NusG
MKWYVIRVVTGKEKKIKDIILNELRNNDSQNIISQLLIPSQKTIQIRKGKKINVEKNFFPGYILVECESIDDVVSHVKHINGVSSVLKQPLSQTEIERILGIQNKKISNDFMVGQKVKIVDGPFNSFVGDIQELDSNRKKIKISVLIFGREVLLDLTFEQIEKV